MNGVLLRCAEHAIIVTLAPDGAIVHATGPPQLCRSGEFEATETVDRGYALGVLYSQSAQAKHRPPHPSVALGPDISWEVEPDPAWRLCAKARRCRYGAGYHTPACGLPAVAEMDRNRSRGRARPNWWGYCHRHLMGRWIEAGEVMRWVARDNSPPF